MKIDQLSTKEVIKLYSASIKELKRRKIIRTNNVIGDMGEYLAIAHYNRILPRHRSERKILMPSAEKGIVIVSSPLVVMLREYFTG